jgi:hypothetical protein
MSDDPAFQHVYDLGIDGQDTALIEGFLAGSDVKPDEQVKTEYGLFNIDLQYFDLPRENWLVQCPFYVFDDEMKAKEHSDKINANRTELGGRNGIERGRVGVKKCTVTRSAWENV